MIFFTGWGMDERVTAHLEPGAFDLWVFSDYTATLIGESGVPEIPARYRECHLIAWSLGVWAAAEVFGGKRHFDSALAINGTLRPIDAEFGIAPEIFHGTINNWHDERARERFLLRLAGSRAALEEFPRPLRSPESQCAELTALAERIQIEPIRQHPFTRALIGTRDRIFPPEAQRAFWGSVNVPAFELEAPHAFFNWFKSWDEVLHAAEDR